MRLRCKKLSLEETKLLQKGDYVVVCDEKNTIYAGNYYFVKLGVNHGISYEINGFKYVFGKTVNSQTNVTMTKIYDSRMSFHHPFEFSHISIYKVLNEKLAEKLLNQQELHLGFLSKIVHYEY